jgi:hypothetical protein
MNSTLKKVVVRLSEEPESPAFRQILELAKDPSVKIGTEGDSHQTAQEVLSLWLARFQTITLRGRRFVGLTPLLRALNELPSEELVEQVALSAGLTTGLVFFLAKTKRPLGAVLSTRTESDVARSRENWASAGASVRTLQTV